MRIETKASFTRIYFDTNPLITANWPKPSAALENLLTLAELLKVGIFVPKAVEDELEAHWNRLFDEKDARAKKSFSDLINIPRNQILSLMLFHC